MLLFKREGRGWVYFFGFSPKVKIIIIIGKTTLLMPVKNKNKPAGTKEVKFLNSAGSGWCNSHGFQKTHQAPAIKGVSQKGNN